MNKGLDMLSYQRELLPTKKRVLMADFMNVVIAAFMAGLSYVLITNYLSNQTHEFSLIISCFIILYLVFNHLIFIKYGFPSFGYFLFDIILH